ncbi:MAG: hypothetical protein ABIH82_05145 [Candidatus Woesearchaeota archaeon]
MKKILIIMAFFVLSLAMMVVAVDKSASVDGASTTVNSAVRLADVTAGSDTTEAGNITDMDLDTTSRTGKWAAYLGEVSAALKIGNASGTALYNWGSVQNDQIKSVFASTDSAFDFSALAAGTASELDTALGWTGADADSAASTFDDTTATIATVTSVPVVNLNAYTAAGAVITTTYQSGLFEDTGSPAAYGDFAFGVKVTPDQKDYQNVTQVDYELLVPVNNSASGGTKTFYFFLDIE